MKRRKIIGLVLILVTFIYFIACLLALYQNQRVKMEKGIEEALKAYSTQEGLNVKELSKDFNLMLEDKMGIEESYHHIQKFEGSFARMEHSITNVTDDIALVEYNMNNLYERVIGVENYYNELMVKLEQNFTLMDHQIHRLQQNQLTYH